MSDTEIKIKSSEINNLLLKIVIGLLAMLTAILTWLGSGMYSAQQKTAEATAVMAVQINIMQKKLDGTMDRHEFDLEMSGLKTRISVTEVRQAAIEVRQSAIDLEIQKMTKP